MEESQEQSPPHKPSWLLRNTRRGVGRVAHLYVILKKDSGHMASICNKSTFHSALKLISPDGNEHRRCPHCEKEIAQRIANRIKYGGTVQGDYLKVWGDWEEESRYGY